MHNRKQFLSYVVPSVFAFALTGIYSIIDGLFIGNSIGDAGLGAINIAYPFTALLQSVGTGIGLGGAVQYSINLHDNKTKNKEYYFYFTLILLLLFSLALAGILFVLMNPVLKAFGATGDMFTFGMEYLKFIILGSVFQVLATGLLPLVRNMGGSVFAMFAMILGFLVNILLDYLFIYIFDYGLSGAALATVIGQMITMIGCILFLVLNKASFIRPPKHRKAEIFSKILRGGISPFGLTFAPNIVLILMNKFSMVYGGEDAVACYAVVAYINMIILLLLQGVGDGSQPLLSLYYGEQSSESVRQVRSMAYTTSAIFAILCMVGLYLSKNYVSILFGASNTVSESVSNVIPIFIVGFLPMAFLRITTSYFYATEKNTLASFLIYSELILLFLCLIIFPHFIKLNGVWISVPVSQALTAIIAGKYLK